MKTIDLQRYWSATGYTQWRHARVALCAEASADIGVRR